MLKPKQSAKRPHKKDTLRLADIKVIPEMQKRDDGVPEWRAKDFEKAIRRGEKFPRVKVYKVDKTEGFDLYLVDGFGTYQGNILAGKKMVDAEVYTGSYDDAEWAACCANGSHDRAGRPRSNESKRRAVDDALAILERTGEQKSNRQIAAELMVGDDLVAELKDLRKPVEERRSPKPSKAARETPWASMPISECFGPEVFGHLKGKDCPKNLGDVFDRLQAGDRMGLSAKALSDVTAVIEEESGKTVSGKARLTVYEPKDETPKSGTVKGVDWTAVKSARDLLMRLPDRVNDEHPGQKDTPYSHGHRRNMKAMIDNLEAWKKVIDKLQPEKGV